MAQKVETTLVDDLDGTEASETIGFSYDGTDYEIDLNTANAAMLRNGLGHYAEHARKVTRKVAGPRRRTAATRREASEIRQWARENGVTVSERGRIPHEVVDRYRAARG